MEFESGYRYGQHTNIGYPLQHYQYSAQNNALGISTGGRGNTRVCTVRPPVGSGRGSFRGGREEDTETGQARRRVAVAVSPHTYDSVLPILLLGLNND